MTTTPTNIARLIEVLTDKTLSEGCILDEAGTKWVVISRQIAPGGYLDFYAFSLTDNSVKVFSGEEIALSRVIQNLGHPVRIGDVLRKCYQRGWRKPELILKILELWGNALSYDPDGSHLDSSLQEIFSCGYEDGYIHDGVFCQSDCTVETSQLKDPAARELATFLFSIFLPDEK